jgi:hypothetical protein
MCTVCVCVCARARERVCACVCACVRVCVCQSAPARVSRRLPDTTSLGGMFANDAAPSTARAALAYSRSCFSLRLAASSSAACFCVLSKEFQPAMASMSRKHPCTRIGGQCLDQPEVLRGRRHKKLKYSSTSGGSAHVAVGAARFVQLANLCAWTHDIAPRDPRLTQHHAPSIAAALRCETLPHRRRYGRPIGRPQPPYCLTQSITFLCLDTTPRDSSLSAVLF